jgi:hypothetical protein
MFMTYILACSMLNPEVCAELRDTHGPYATEKQCIERAVELSRKLDVVFTVPQTYSYKCVKGNES